MRKDFDNFPVEGVNGKATENDIIQKLRKYGIKKSDSDVSVQFWGTGKPKREFLLSDDLADALVYIFENLDFIDLVKDLNALKAEVKDIRNTHINIGTGKDITIRSLAEMISDIIAYKGNIEWDTSRPDGTNQKLMDVSKINSLGWKHKVSLEEGIKIVYEWYK